MNIKQHILSSVKNRILRIDPEAKVILFGSRARDDFHSDSDWDFLILTKGKTSRSLKNKISDTLFEAELETDQVFTGIVKNFEVWSTYAGSPIFNNISKDGIEI